VIAFVAAGFLAFLGIALITNMGGVADRLGDYGRRQRDAQGSVAPGMTSGEQLKMAGWAMLLVLSPVCLVVGIINVMR
jgi:hypothetical protein